MEFEENSEIEEQDDEGVEIYSKKAVFWFSFLLGPIFGSVLLILNLREAGYKKAVSVVLLFTILIDILSQVVIFFYIKYNHIDLVAIQQKMANYKSGDAYPFDQKYVLMIFIALAIRLTGALIISQYFFKKYFPENDYYPKSISTILPLCLLVCIVLQIIGLAI
jgi:hypothetical protein